MSAAKAPTRATTLPAARPEAPPVYGTGPVGVAVGAVQVLVPLLDLVMTPVPVPVALLVLVKVTGLVITDVMMVLLVLVTGVVVVMIVVDPLVVEV